MPIRTTSKMTFIHGDDWEGIYIDGKLETEGHSHAPAEAVRLAILRNVAEVEVKECDFNWLHDEGNLPVDLSDVKYPEA